LLGSIGLAGAGATLGGVGTQAFFSDQESFDNNRLLAGELDLMVDWQEHYSNWSEDEKTAAPGARMVDGPEDLQEGEIGFPSYQWPILAVPEDEAMAFWEATSQEAYPDENDDGVQDTIKTRNQLSTEYPLESPEEIEARFRDQYAQVPEDLPAPVISLEDLKPGDFGDVTFSFHLFNNPGYIWMNGRLLADEEVSVNEAEADDPDEDNVPGGTFQPGDGELLETIEVLIWHDDGDNLHEDPELVDSPHDVDNGSAIELTGEQAVIARGTFDEVLADLSTGHGIPLDADARGEPRECFPNSTTRYVGFAWWLPVDHANEIQTDRIQFDLGFYTEQCRHNDGSGLPPTETPNSTITTTPTDT
jgi:predicted ribosomally synthesized peptide with SipW-like signal peptide